MAGTLNRPCPKCGETYTNGFDLVEEDGKVYDLHYLSCEGCGHETKGTRKFLGLESEAWSEVTA